MKTRFLLSFFLLMIISFPFTVSAHEGSIDAAVDSILKGKRMTVGVSARYGRKTYRLNADMPFPMMSVFKVHVALTVLDKLNREKASVDSVITISRNQIKENTYSPMRQKYPEGPIKLTVRELIDYAVSESDNNACDILINLAGGTVEVDKYIRTLGVTDFQITRTEDDMHADLNKVYDNWSTPDAMTQLLMIISRANSIPENSVALLQSAMLKAGTGLNKIAAGKPRCCLLIHKTGSSDRIGGIKTADNDAGIVVFPGNTKPVYLTVFIKESAESDDVNAKVIADITKTILTHFFSAHIYNMCDNVPK